jgi:hypothetical protein
MAVKKKQRDSTNPNTTLVLFLVFFVLLSIGVGVWGYYGYAGQEKLRESAKKAERDTEAARTGQSYYRLIKDEVFIALLGDAALDPEELGWWNNNRGDLLLDDGSLNQAGKLAKEADADKERKLLADVKTDLGGFNAATKKYAATYRERHRKLSDELKDAKAGWATAVADAKDAKDKLNNRDAKEAAYWKTAMADIQKYGQQRVLEAKASNERLEKLMVLLENEKNALTKREEEFDTERKQLIGKIKKQSEQLVKLQQDQGPGQVAGGASGAAPHALLLDVSKGKPLWDLPLGKITGVTPKDRQVMINLGSSHGIRPALTFNVFAAGWDGRADKGFKGTIEVIKVVGSTSSLARITSQYDETGLEIPLNDPVRGRLQREAENAFKEGDLLFNLAWGTHVAVIGHVNLSGYSTESPVEQMRNLQTFMGSLQRQGVIVDAYVDLTDGSVKGDITNKTRYLIRGEIPVMNDKADDRSKLVHEAALALRKDATEKGVFIISSDNFANAIGYRRPRSLNDLEKSADFRPSMPFAGAGARGGVIAVGGEPRGDDQKAKEMEKEAK